MDRTQIIERSLGLAQAVAGFVAGARQFFHAVMLHGHRCPSCGGSLQMEWEGRCRCRGCGDIFDPTAAFQRCPACGGSARLRIRRYECATCHTEIVSRFLFDGRVFDATYFRQKMAEHRRRKRELRNRVRQMLSETRSDAIAVPPAELAGVPGLLEALNSLTAGTESVRRARTAQQRIRGALWRFDGDNPQTGSADRGVAGLVTPGDAKAIPATIRAHDAYARSPSRLQLQTAAAVVAGS